MHRALLQAILANSPLALGGVLEAVDQQEGRPLDEALDLESRRFGDLAGTPDFEAGTRAFLEKRKPTFR